MDEIMFTRKEVVVVILYLLILCLCILCLLFWDDLPLKNLPPEGLAYNRWITMSGL